MMENIVCSYNFLARPGFIVRKIAGENTLVPIDTDNIVLMDESRIPVFNGVIQLNDLALLLWNSMQTPMSYDELFKIVDEKYDITNLHAEVRNDILMFLEKGIKNQVILLTKKEEI